MVAELDDAHARIAGFSEVLILDFGKDLTQAHHNFSTNHLFRPLIIVHMQNATFHFEEFVHVIFREQ